MVCSIHITLTETLWLHLFTTSSVRTTRKKYKSSPPTINVVFRSFKQLLQIVFRLFSTPSCQFTSQPSRAEQSWGRKNSKATSSANKTDSNRSSGASGVLISQASVDVPNPRVRSASQADKSLSPIASTPAIESAHTSDPEVSIPATQKRSHLSFDSQVDHSMLRTPPRITRIETAHSKFIKDYLLNATDFIIDNVCPGEVELLKLGMNVPGDITN